MPKLPNLTGDAVIHALEKIGFQKIRQIRKPCQDETY
jgi:predicted RNA binding protein YcfA (HicA-like mRNA interferase family)